MYKISNIYKSLLNNVIFPLIVIIVVGVFTYIFRQQNNVMALTQEIKIHKEMKTHLNNTDQEDIQALKGDIKAIQVSLNSIKSEQKIVLKATKQHMDLSVQLLLGEIRSLGKRTN